jgi:hypothetical protein
MLIRYVSGRFGGTYRLHLQCGKKNIFCFHRGDYEDGMLHAVNVLFADISEKHTASIISLIGYIRIFEVLTLVSVKKAVFWDVLQCKCCVSRRFGGMFPPKFSGFKKNTKL